MASGSMHTLAVDIGGTRIKVGLVAQRRLIAQQLLEARSHEGLQPQLPRIAAALRDLCGANHVDLAACHGLGIAFPGVIDDQGWVLDSYGKYGDAPQIDLRAWSQQQLGLTLAIDNDARAALLGEWLAGAGKGCNDFVMVTLGTGIGTSALMSGQLVRGRHGQAGILGGHITVRYDGKACVCGNRGCAETEAPRADYAALFDLARAGDPRAIAQRDRSIEVWAAVSVSLIHSYDPERVVMGGGVSEGAADFLAELTRQVHSRAHTPWGRVEIVPALLGNSAALLGAAHLVERHEENS